MPSLCAKSCVVIDRCSDADNLAAALKVLLQAGLVEREQRGSWAFYRVAPDQLQLLRNLLV